MAKTSKAWETRRKNQAALARKRKKAAQKAWETRRETYGPSGRS